MVFTELHKVFVLESDGAAKLYIFLFQYAWNFIHTCSSKQTTEKSACSGARFVPCTMTCLTCPELIGTLFVKQCLDKVEFGHKTP